MEHWANNGSLMTTTLRYHSHSPRTAGSLFLFRRMTVAAWYCGISMEAYTK